ncbi:hypothetical protein NQ314_010397, partial [Rhamnusium bicolor]
NYVIVCYNILVNITFYDINIYTSEVRWVPNSHYSGIHGLLKLVFPRIVPINVTSRLLVLDTDLTVVSDIYDLWKMFSKFNNKQAIGIVENQSDYYLGKHTNYNTWPAIGRGFNSGVLLYNLQVLRKINWPNLWSNIVHWNSPKKYNVQNKDGDYFRNLATGFMEYNGNLLRKQLQFCDIAQNIGTNRSNKFCSEFHRLLTTSWRTILYFREYKHSVLENDVTFVAQLSYDRLQTIEELVKYWPGNVGLRNVQTPYVFLADIDFLPNKDLYEMLRNYFTSMDSLTKKALIVPAFEIQKYGSLIPRNKNQLLKELKDKSVIPFLSSIWSPGHAPTNYEKWKTAEEPYQRFVGFGWNKVSHIMELEAQNYKFIVLPDVFIVHKPHGPSYDIGRYRSSPTYRLCLQMLKEEFIQKLNKDYNRLFEYSNSSISFTNVASKRRKRNFVPSVYTTVETNTDYPFNTE